ncbi:MAG: hypothetical protein WC304_01075 [Candidatus Gracilibacteria bacterium]|jgi:hypothetical protein
MQAALQETISTTPYNSFAAFARKAGFEVAPALGGNCVFQNNKLSDSLRKEGYETFSLSSPSSPHCATICKEDGDLHYLDPFLLAKEPINLTELLTLSRKRIFSAFSFSAEYPNKIVFSPSEESPTQFQIALWRFSKKQRRYGKLRSYDYDLRDKSSEKPSPKDESLYLRQKKLVLRFSCEEGCFSEVNIDTHSGEMNTILLDQYSAQNYNQELFLKKLEEIAKRLRVEISELLPTFCQGYSAYLDHVSSHKRI